MNLKQTKPRPTYSCRKTFTRIFQFKIILDQTRPLVWRRIEVPSCYSFWDLHCAIIDSFGWLDYHLHKFEVLNPKTGKNEILGIPDDDELGIIETLPGWEVKIDRYFSLTHPTAQYEYDFGDSWEHPIVLEAILPREAGVVYPRCVGGENACPPEDCGGIPGYDQFKKSIAYHNSPDHDAMLDWVGCQFDPTWFDIQMIRFSDPTLRWKVAFCERPMPKNFRVKQYHHLRDDPAQQKG